MTSCEWRQCPYCAKVRRAAEAGLPGLLQVAESGKVA